MVKDKRAFFLYVVIGGLLACCGSLALGGAKVIDLQLAFLISQVAAAVVLGGTIPLIIYVIVGIWRIIMGRRIRRLHH
jgi:hypothetical protein